ncbi:MAG: response regulator [Ignavibacteriales bacterium]|nr:MAG: response regulator [Ignavibacteriaceae bacterium]MBW7873164.1 response regulator [Ignavibacteria bacterium]MCZ2142806.1 response regulator [Ignavibacteriales bacterium]OQY70302.1 MAG: hypothetical protein B6D45_11395 [Ignavibacteriales bacterium UTCHB3]MBV6443900.1 Chromosome partition protein Smc [Ignavibacteriaceae bacterium]
MSLFSNYRKEYEELLNKFEELQKKHQALESANGDILRLNDEIEMLKYEHQELESKLNNLKSRETDISILLFSKQSELEKIEQATKETASDIEEKSSLIRELDSTILSKRPEAEKLSRQLTALLGEVEEAKNKYDEFSNGLSGLREEEATKRSNLIKLQQEIDQLKYEREKFSNLEALKVKYDEVNDSVQEILKQRAHLDLEVRELNDTRNKLIEEINKMRNDMLAQRALFEQQVVHEKVAVEKELIQLKNQLDDSIRNRQEQLSNLDREFSEAKIRYSNLVSTTDQVVQNLNESEKKIEMLKFDKDNLTDQANSLQAKVESLTNRASALDAEVQGLNRQIERLNEERLVASGLVEQLKSSILGLTGSKEEMVEIISKLNEQLSEKNKTYSATYQEYQNLLEHLQKRKIEVVNLKGIIEIRSRKLKDIDRELASLEALRDEYENDLRQILDLQKSLNYDLNNSQENVQSLQDTISALRKKFTEILKIRKARQESLQRERKRIIDEQEDYENEIVSDSYIPPAVPTASRIKGIFADPDQTAFDEMNGILAGSVIDLNFVDSGTKAFDSLKSEPYNLAFFDLNLPGMSAIEIIERMRASNVYKSIPIFAILESPDEHLESQAHNAGVSGIIYKPFSAELVLSEIRKFITF